MTDPVTRTFYRIIRDEMPSIDDFLSDEVAGKPPPVGESPDLLRMWRGFSVYATEAQARNKARSLGLGTHLAALTIPPDSGITAARTGKTRGHHTIWGNAEEVRQCVTRVVEV